MKETDASRDVYESEEKVICVPIKETRVCTKETYIRTNKTNKSMKETDASRDVYESEEKVICVPIKETRVCTKETYIRTK